MLQRVPKIPWGVALKLKGTQETCPLRMVCLDTQETEWTYQETGQAKKNLCQFKDWMLTEHGLYFTWMAVTSEVPGVTCLLLS